MSRPAKKMTVASSLQGAFDSSKIEPRLAETINNNAKGKALFKSLKRGQAITVKQGRKVYEGKIVHKSTNLVTIENGMCLDSFNVNDIISKDCIITVN